MNFDVVILGSGLAGLASALKLAPNRKVAIVTKKTMLDGASNWAQGGIAAVVDAFDTHESHVNDTMVAGAHLSDPNVTRLVVEKGAAGIDWLIGQGVNFTKDKNTSSGLHLTMEGGHSFRRIIHAKDATGHAVQTTLEERARLHPNITILENHVGIDLITTIDSNTGCTVCCGIYVLDSNKDSVVAIQAPIVILATGGAGKSYLYTTNPDTSTGDGIAIGWRAGCSVSNMEFIQFHPTCLYHPEAKSFLISEALRGEGGLLLLPNGHRFMPEYDSRAELAPRDVVARSIDAEMKKHGIDCVYLDISHRGLKFIKAHFPNIYKRCLELGIDASKQPIPVVPAAHYTCGGINTTLDGLTDINGLYAVGETAHTGLHGANRLASNSLLECLVFSEQAANHIMNSSEKRLGAIKEWDESQVTDSDEEVVIAHNWDELRRFMWNYVGIVRTTKRLERAEHRLKFLTEEIRDYYSNFRVTRDLLELRNLVEVSRLIVRCALRRQESRGLHFSADYPSQNDTALNTICDPKDS
ncbi:MAG: L-aspartate oxidase [Burkholderiales bacterium]|nr:L-aspartate oxidase [Burkholderiales bacterium]OUT78616.1 MAG: L-aspartate oxidase [Betaproteobacteria bacterium TMED22]